MGHPIAWCGPDLPLEETPNVQIFWSFLLGQYPLRRIFQSTTWGQSGERDLWNPTMQYANFNLSLHQCLFPVLGCRRHFWIQRFPGLVWRVYFTQAVCWGQTGGVMQLSREMASLLPSALSGSWHFSLYSFWDYAVGTILHLIDFPLLPLHPTLLPHHPTPLPDIGHLLLFIHPVFIFPILSEILTLLFFLLVGLSFFIPPLLFLESNKTHVCNSPC